MTSSLAAQELITGALVSFVISLFSYKHFSQHGMGHFHPLKLYYVLNYFIVFLIELVKSNLDVAMRVINPRMPIKPGIVKIQTRLENPVAKMILANSITLTPGTLTVDLIDQDLYIHWLVVNESDASARQEAIAGKFEPILMKIFS